MVRLAEREVTDGGRDTEREREIGERGDRETLDTCDHGDEISMLRK